VLVTDVPRVMLDYGTPNARPIGCMTVNEAQTYAERHQFPDGSMGPKVRACIQFLREGGRLAVITNAERACASVDPGVAEGPETGTRIVTEEQCLGATT
jgi:carbamate kinase